MYKCPKCGCVTDRLWVVRRQWTLISGDKEVSQKKTRFHTRESEANCPECDYFGKVHHFFLKWYQMGHLSLDIGEDKNPVFVISSTSTHGTKLRWAFPVNRDGYKKITATFADMHIEHLTLDSCLDFPSEYGVRPRQVNSCLKAVEKGLEVC